MKKMQFIFVFVCICFYGCDSQDLPEPQQLIGEWKFEEVRKGKLIDFCPDDVTPEFQDKVIEFKQGELLIKDAQTKLVLASGSWESEKIPLYLGDEIQYEDALTTQFSTLVGQHDFSWKKVRYGVNKKRLSFRSCQQGSCYRYEFVKQD